MRAYLKVRPDGGAALVADTLDQMMVVGRRLGCDVHDVVRDGPFAFLLVDAGQVDVAVGLGVPTLDADSFANVMLRVTADSAIGEFRGSYRWLSNFHRSEFVWDGLVWPTVEHAFQGAKTFDAVQREAVRRQVSPGGAKRAGRRVSLRSDWHAVRVAVMSELVSAKFGQDVRLGRLLAGTGQSHLEEGNGHGDRFWGTVGGVGWNMLGRTLMDVRGQLT